MYHPQRSDHGHYQSWRSVRTRKNAAHNHALALFVAILMVAFIVALQILAPDTDWLDVFGKVAARGWGEWVK